jgi:hypothetical protein
MIILLQIYKFFSVISNIFCYFYKNEAAKVALEDDDTRDLRKIGANAFLRKAEEAYKHKGFRENWLTDSGSEGLGFESQRDHKR